MKGKSRPQTGNSHSGHSAPFFYPREGYTELARSLFALPRIFKNHFGRYDSEGRSGHPCMDEAKARVYAAAFLSPLSIIVALPVVGASYSSFHGAPLEIAGWIQAAPVFLAFAYPAMLLVGVPAYLALRRFELDTLWSAVIVGYLTAAAVPIVLWLGGVYGVPPSSPAYWLNPLFLLGPVVGFVFWWVAKPRPVKPARSASSRH